MKVDRIKLNNTPKFIVFYQFFFIVQNLFKRLISDRIRKNIGWKRSIL